VVVVIEVVTLVMLMLLLVVLVPLLLLLRLVVLEVEGPCLSAVESGFKGNPPPQAQQAELAVYPPYSELLPYCAHACCASYALQVYRGPACASVRWKYEV
jgi:hypothetical protein